MKPEKIKTGRLYDDLAYLMPFISPHEEYEEEAMHWKRVLRDKLGEGKHSLLELGAGGGFNLFHLKNEFEITASDISQQMLDLCSKLNPEIVLYQGDMRTLRLQKKFKAVLIHDAISYMLTEDELLAAFKTAADHLEPEGVFITSPDNFIETIKFPKVDYSIHKFENIEVTYTEYTYDPDINDNSIETIMTYYIRDKNGFSIEYDRHITGLFTETTWIRLMEKAGFIVEKRIFELSSISTPYILLVGTLHNEC